jgi:hypothetical protein
VPARRPAEHAVGWVLHACRTSARDYEEFVKAIHSGRLEAREEV